MTSINNQTVLIRNLDGIFFNFYLSDNKILYDCFDKDGVHLSNNKLSNHFVLDFSVEIDDNDNIHLISITNDGNLIYYMFSSDNWVQKTITKLDIKSNIYKYLKLKLNEGKINIFYSYSNLIMPNVWRIEHIFNNNGKFSKKTIISFTSGKLNSPYEVELDSFKNIHLLYKNCINNLNQIMYSCFNYLTGKWITYPKKISILNTDNLHPFLFIDTRGNIHSIWCELKNSNINLIYNKKPSTGINKNKWLKINLPSLGDNCSHPILFEEDKILKIIYRHNNYIRSLHSEDYGNSWKTDNILPSCGLNDFTVLNFSSNIKDKNHTLKANLLYGCVNDNILLYNVDTYKEYISINYDTTPKIDNLEDINNDLQFNMNLSKPNNNDLSQNIEKPKIPYKSFIDDNINKFNNEDIKAFLVNIKDNLDKISRDINEISNLKKEIENIIVKNAEHLEKNVTNKEVFLNDKLSKLNELEIILNSYEFENKNSLKTISIVEDKLIDNSNKIKSINLELEELKDDIKSISKPKILNKISNIFK